MATDLVSAVRPRCWNTFGFIQLYDDIIFPTVSGHVIEFRVTEQLSEEKTNKLKVTLDGTSMMPVLVY